MKSARQSLFLMALAMLAACGFDSGFVGPCDTDHGSSSGSSSSTGGSSGDPEMPTTGSGSDGATGSTGEPGSTESSSTSGGPDDGSSSSSGAEGESSSGDFSCDTNSECDETDVCSSGECVDAWSIPHAVRILEWNEPCDGAGTNVFFARRGGVDTDTSGCPQQWPNDWWTVVGGAAFEVDFYEAGSAPNPDQYITSWCWDSGLGCGPIPKALLHAGGTTASWGDWNADFDFEVVR